MAESIVICEKPSQARALQKALGGKYGKILPARGHILTLKEPEEVRTDWEDWSATLLWPGKFYEKKVSSDTRELFEAIKRESRDAKRIIIATDCDREGQLIGDEIVDFIGFRGQVYRAMFNAEDPKSLQDAFQKLRPTADYRGLYMSGQAREQADQISNLSLTRTATVTLKAPGTRGAIGIGRVKTPVLGIICARELEIENFKPQDMFEIDALTKVAAGELTLSCTRMPKSLIKEQEAIAAEEEEGEEELTGDDAEVLAEAESMVGKIMRRDIAEKLKAAVVGHKGPLSAKYERKKQGPPKLFDLTALQSAASGKFSWTGEKTLEVAQALYSERTLITYPRGEARYLPENNIADVPKLVPALLRLQGFGKFQPLVQQPIVRKGKSGHFSDKALEGMSHYAIIPNVNTADQFERLSAGLSPDETRLFDLIVRQYLAALAPDHEYRQTTIDMVVPFANHNWDFRASGRIPLVPGWKAIIGGGGAKAGSEEDSELPDVKSGETGEVLSATMRTVTTRPPARHTEGTLLKLMQEAWRLVPADKPDLRRRLKEAKGIGTPATRGSVLKGLFKQGQLVMAGKSIKPSEGGMKLYKVLMEVCPNVVDPTRTAMWETIFDMVEKGKITAEQAVLKILEDTQKEIERISSRGGSVSINIGKSVKPSDKMIIAAERIAERKGIPLPKGLKSDMTICRTFLEAHLPQREKNADGTDAPFPPSEKQLALARSLSESLGKSIPDEALSSSKALSAWIDGLPARPPSEKQLALAQRLAEENEIDLPAAAQNDGKACSAFIDKHMGKSKGGSSRGSSRGSSSGYGGRKSAARR